MFDVNDRVLLVDDGIEAIVVGKDEHFKNLMLVIPVECDTPNYTWSSFTDNMIKVG